MSLKLQKRNRLLSKDHFDDTSYNTISVISDTTRDAKLAKSENRMEKAKRISDNSDTKYNNVITSFVVNIPDLPKYSYSSYAESFASFMSGYKNGSDVVFLTSIIFVVHMISCDIWIPYIFKTTDQLSLEWFTFSDVITTIILILPFSKLINNYGFMFTLLFMCTLSILGTAIRCWAFSDYSYLQVLLHVSAIFLSSAKVCIKPLAVSITGKYYKRGLTHFATGFQISMAMMGTAAGYLSKMVVPEALGFDLNEPYQSKMFVMYIMYTCLAMGVVCVISVFALFPHEPILDASYDPIEVPDKSLNSARTVLANKNFWALTGSYVCSYAFSWPWFQAFKWPWDTFQAVTDFQTFRIEFQFWMMVHTCCLCLTTCFFADRVVPKHRKGLAAVFQFLAVVFLLGLVAVRMAFKTYESYNLIHLVIIMCSFSLSWSTQCLLLEINAKSMYPATRSLTVALMEMANVLCQAFVYLIMFFQREFYLKWLIAFIISSQVLSYVFLIMFEENCKEH